MSEVKAAISSARLVLGSAFAYRFDINEEYTGKITISYTEKGDTVTREYAIINGEYNGYSYIDIRLNSADIRSNIFASISDGAGKYLVGKYNLYTYIDAMEGKSASLDSLLVSLYSYSVAADNYNKTK